MKRGSHRSRDKEAKLSRGKLPISASIVQGESGSSSNHSINLKTKQNKTGESSKRQQHIRKRKNVLSQSDKKKVDWMSFRLNENLKSRCENENKCKQVSKRAKSSLNLASGFVTNTKSKSSIFLLELPEEMLVRIVLFSDLPTANILMRCCKRINAVCKMTSEDLWKLIAMDRFPILKQTVPLLAPPVRFEALLKKQLMLEAQEDSYAERDEVASKPKSLKSYLFSFEFVQCRQGTSCCPSATCGKVQNWYNKKCEDCDKVMQKPKRSISERKILQWAGRSDTVPIRADIDKSVADDLLGCVGDDSLLLRVYLTNSEGQTVQVMNSGEDEFEEHPNKVVVDFDCQNLLGTRLLNRDVNGFFGVMSSVEDSSLESVDIGIGAYLHLGLPIDNESKQPPSYLNIQFQHSGVAGMTLDLLDMNKDQAESFLEYVKFD